MNDLGVADELEGHELDGAGDVVVLYAVLVALDGRDYQALHLADRCELTRKLLGLCQVQRDATRLAADLSGDGLRAGQVTAADDHFAASCRQLFRKIQPDARSSAND